MALFPRMGPARRILLVVFCFIVLLLILRTPTSTPAYAWRTRPGHAHDRPLQNQRGGSDQRPLDASRAPALDDPDYTKVVADRDNSHPRARLSKQFQEWLQWDPPQGKDHYPPYEEYEQRDYDPNRWEGFPQEHGVFINGTVRHLRGHAAQRPYLPYPNYKSDDWKNEYAGAYVSCDGPRGKPLDQSYEDLMTAYMSRPEGFPYPDVGSWEAVGMHEDLCFDRYGRLGPYGFEVDVHEAGITHPSRVQWSAVEWGKLQDACLAKNANRFHDATKANTRTGKLTESRGALQRPAGVAARRGDSRSRSDDDSSSADAGPDNARRAATGADANGKKTTTKTREKKKKQKRTAVLIRTWDDYHYRDNDKQMIRSLITELNLLSGGEYHVFLFVNVKDKSKPIFSSEEAYQRALEEYVPKEFRDIAILWTEEVCAEWYPLVKEWSEVYWSQFMPLQWFSKTHPEFDFVWNWEMDARLIGHHYHFLEQMADFGRGQPRKYLWERNSRYYIPKAHGTWEQFFQDSNAVIHGARAAHAIKTVWGPQRWTTDQSVLGPTPPRPEDQDDFEWGVGEEADLITLLPLWDPRETFWSYRDKVFNYPLSEASYDERPYPHIPRRVFINTLVRLSKELLDAMHFENKVGFHMASELWPGSIALQHGFKAVYAPHPVWVSHQWPAEYLDAVINADGWGAGGLPGGTTDNGRGRAYNLHMDLAGRPQTGSGPNREGAPGRWAQERDSPYSPDREHYFAGWSWYFWSDFSRVLYWRWLGWPAGFSIVTIRGTEVVDELGVVGGGQFEEEHGRSCMPPMLLHPIKNVRHPDEVEREEALEAARKKKEQEA